MPGLCAAVDCNNRTVRQELQDLGSGPGQGPGEESRESSTGTGRRRSFHRFPLKNPPLLKQWLHNMRRKGFTPTKNHVLCSDHFTESCFEVSLEVRFGINQ